MILVLLIIAICITVATEVIKELVKLLVNENAKVGLVTAFVFGLVGAFLYNVGLIETLIELMGIEFTTPLWAHYFDLTLTGIILTKGSSGIISVYEKLKQTSEQLK